MTKEKQELGIVVARKDEISIPGATFTRTGLRWDGTPTETTITNAGALLHVMRSVTDWGEADYLPQMVALRLGRSRRKVSRDNREQLEIAAVVEFAELNGRDARALRLRDRVGRFFPAPMRREELSFEHHVEAWVACEGDLARACAWLDAAVRDSMTVARLRSHIRAHAATSAASEDDPPASDAHADEDAQLASMDLAAARMLPLVRTYDRDRAERELRAIESVVRLVDALREATGEL